jgi:hypothetical protein
MRLEGLRILEIAPWNAFFGFECLRRGAREVVFPNTEYVNAWARSSGFGIVHESPVKGWQYIQGRKAKRLFSLGLENTT